METPSFVIITCVPMGGDGARIIGVCLGRVKYLRFPVAFGPSKPLRWKPNLELKKPKRIDTLLQNFLVLMNREQIANGKPFVAFLLGPDLNRLITAPYGFQKITT